MTVAQSCIQVHIDFFVTVPDNYERHNKHFQDFIYNDHYTIYKTIKQITIKYNKYNKIWKMNIQSIGK